MINTLTPSIKLPTFILSSLLMLFALTSATQAQTLFDGSFSNTDWISTVLPYPLSEPNAQCVSCGQDSNGNPSPSRKITHVYDGTSGNPRAIWVAHLYRPVSSFYDPSTQGAIGGLSYSYDLIQYSGGNQAVTYALLLYQNNTYYLSYRSNSPATETDKLYHSLSWQSYPLPSATPKILTSMDFQQVSNSGSLNHPDFSCNGSLIQFGYVTGNSNTGNTISAVDNWKVEIFKGEACVCLKRIKEKIECGRRGSYIYTVDLQNLTGADLQQILIIPLTPRSVVVTPQMLPVKLAPKETATLRLAISRAPLGATVLLRFSPSDVGSKCCASEISLTVPKRGKC